MIRAALLAIALTGCAGTPALKDRAVGGQVADVASTAVALSLPGVVETNPLGLAVLPLKVVAFAWAETQPPEVTIDVHRGLSAFGWGAAAANLCIAAVVATGGTAALPCYALGIGVGRWDWTATEGTDREQFDRLCKYARRNNPALECIWSAP